MNLTHANRDLFVELAFKKRLEELAPVAHLVRQGICELAPIPIIDLMPISALERLVSGGSICYRAPFKFSKIYFSYFPSILAHK